MNIKTMRAMSSSSSKEEMQMNGLCLVVRPYATEAIYGVYLVDAEENVDPVDVIKHYCRKVPTVPWHVDSWDEHADGIEWFVVKDIERLKTIDWPDQSSQSLSERVLQLEDKVQVYRAFEIKQVTLVQALDALGNEVITKARGLGWTPCDLKVALENLAWAMTTDEQAKAYREVIMSVVDDIGLAVRTTEPIYESDAYQFLEEEMEPSGPKAPEDMADDELIHEATQSYGSIYAGDVTGRVREFFTDTVMANRWGSDEVIRHAALEAELFNRDYEVLAVLTPSSYSVQKREEE